MATILITGANRGIGLEMARRLRDRGDMVVAACRSPSEELTKLEGDQLRVEADVDVTSAASLESLRARLGEVRLDWLVNNAGLLLGTSLQSWDESAVQQMFEVNALGPLRTTVALLPLLKQGSKVGLVTSRMGSIADNSSGGSYGYRMSKAALNAAGKSLAVDLQRSGIAVAILHPGWVRTDMTGHTGNVDPAEAAAGLIARLDELTLETSGKFLHQNGSELPW